MAFSQAESYHGTEYSVPDAIIAGMPRSIGLRGGRQGEAARNDQRILGAAREVFLADPEAPISAVANRAGVGIGTLYRRYPGKDALLRHLAKQGLQRYVAIAEAALQEKDDAWTSFSTFMRRALEAGSGSLTARFDAAFTATADMHRLGRQASELTRQVLRRTQRAGALRQDIEVGDLSLLLEQLQSVKLASAERNRQLRHRYLALALDALHKADSEKLPGPPPRWEEISGRYQAAPDRSAGSANRRPTRPPGSGRARRAGQTARRRGR